MKRRKPSDLPKLVGKTFGRFKVIRTPYRVKGSQLVALCLCDCGVRKIVNLYSVWAGKTVSCGHATGLKKITHGHSIGKPSLTYYIWSAMLQRCNSPKYRRYDRYGGRGIKVCKRWEKFANFLADMGVAPAGKMLDRKDNDRDYAPSNCRWVSRDVQMQNRNYCKLDVQKVRVIRRRYAGGESVTDIARAMNVGSWVVRKAVRRETWKNV